MQKSIKFGLYLLLALGLAAILLVLAKSVVDPKGKQARIEQNDKGAEAVIGQLVQLKPRPAQPNAVFLDGNGQQRQLSEFNGKVILLNVWATWCPPCVEEMPSLDQLQAQLGGADFAVVAISVDRQIKDAESFFADHNINNLALYQDKGFDVVRQLYVKDYPSGLPISVLYDRQGRELARLSGGFDWVSEAAISRIEQAISTSHLPE
ncbi:hypothetical protein MNBD_ALPHA06-7 [hydrothermal vent metagenome]|uniref:Thioredoxin domain-containing protein n=1 Tax=hydrothermal vent metagenome TaxID=652676 RepID=A0A3B0R772_9ZZZZ